MPGEPLQEVLNLLNAFGTVAAVAGPLATVCWLISHKSTRFLHVSIIRPRWTGGETFLLFALNLIAPTVLFALLAAVGFYSVVIGPGWDKFTPDILSEITAITGGFIQPEIKANLNRREIWAMGLAVPVVLMAAWLVRPWKKTIQFRQFANDITLGVIVWFILSPCVFLVHLASNSIILALGSTPDTHPASYLGFNPNLMNTILFFVGVCVAAPVMEEFLFRGVLFSWAMRKRYAPGIIAMVSILLACVSTQLSPIVFVFVISFVLFFYLQKRSAAKKRSTTSIWATAMIFGMVHASVWPTPVPLFVMGLGLGIVAAITGRVLPTMVAHGLFNAISTLLVLRGQA